MGPSCPHFGTCGGCTLYHLPDAAYIALKSEHAGDGSASCRLRRHCIVAARARRSRRATPHGPGRASRAWRGCTRPASATQRRRRRSDHLPCPTSDTGQPDAALARTAGTPSGFPPRRLNDRQSARLRRRSAGAHRCATCIVGSHCPDRVCPQLIGCRVSPGRSATTNRNRSRYCAHRRRRSPASRSCRRPVRSCRLQQRVRLPSSQPSLRPFPTRDALRNCSRVAAQSPSPWRSVAVSPHGRATQHQHPLCAPLQITPVLPARSRRSSVTWRANRYRQRSSLVLPPSCSTRQSSALQRRWHRSPPPNLRSSSTLAATPPRCRATQGSFDRRASCCGQRRR